MARTTIVKAARKDQGRCASTRCLHPGEPILAGQSYKWFKRKASYGGVVFKFHVDCYISPTQRSTSRMAEIEEARNDLDVPGFDGQDDTSDLASAAEEFAQTVREVSEGYEESASNIEEGFGHETYQSQELRERAEALESWADDLESLDFEEFEHDEDALRQEIRDILDREDSESDEDYDERVDAEYNTRLEELKNEWWDEQVGVLENELDNCPV